MENILEKINAYQEILATMPTNNKKNIEKYNMKIDEILTEYKEYQKSLLDEIKKRYDSKTNINENEEISKKENELSNYEMLLEIIDDTKTSYEKSNLDKEVYRLGKFYKENLENVNVQIMTCINIFRNIGIEITSEEFSSSIFAKEYMDVFLVEMKNGDVNSENVKKKFEEIYWKCPDLIVHIEVIINNIFLKYKKDIEKYFEDKKAKTLKKYNINEDEILTLYKETKKQLDKIKSMDKKIILSQFLSGEINIKDYENEKIDKIYEKLLTKEAYDKMQNDNEYKEEVNSNIIKFINSITEYKYFLKYNFILESIKEKYKVKDEYKNKVKENLKDIDNLDKKIKKNIKPGLFSKKDANTSEINETFISMKDKYKELSKNIIYSKIAEKLTGNSTIHDALTFASCFYKFLVDEIIKTNKDITQDEIDNFIKEFKENVSSPYFTIINNIKILEEKDIALIIKDRYRLLNFNIEKGDISEDNLDNILSDLEKIKIRDCIDKSGLTIEEIESICEYEKILKNN